MRIVVRYLLTLLLLGTTIAQGSEIEYMALNIYHEARGEPIAGQLAVFYVTINRTKSVYFPDTISEVIYQKGQFEWTGDGLSDDVKDQATYDEIYKNTTEFLNNIEYYNDPTNGALFYHAKHVKPCWIPDATLLADIGNHLFYEVDPKGVSCWRKR